MVSFLISLPIIGLAWWLVAGTTSRMWRLRAGWAWWATLSLLVLLGGYAGYRLGRCEIQTSATFRWGGLPLPIAFFALEGDRWTDFIPPPPVQWTNLLADILAPVLLMAIPLAIIWRRKARMHLGRQGLTSGSSQ
jgi:hypothetical protein